jgi:hypothetical protein
VLVGAGLRGDKQPPDKDAMKAYEAASKGIAEEFVNVIMKSGLYATVREGTPAYARLRQIIPFAVSHQFANLTSVHYDLSAWH